MATKKIPRRERNSSSKNKTDTVPMHQQPQTAQRLLTETAIAVSAVAAATVMVTVEVGAGVGVGGSAAGRVLGHLVAGGRLACGSRWLWRGGASGRTSEFCCWAWCRACSRAAPLLSVRVGVGGTRQEREENDTTLATFFVRIRMFFFVLVG